MEPILEFLVLLSTASNTWFITVCSVKKNFDAANLFLVQLAVLDFLHDIHACLFRVAPGDGDDYYWNLINLFLGYVISFGSLLVILRLLIRELTLNVENIAAHSAIKSFLSESLQVFLFSALFVSPVLFSTTSVWSFSRLSTGEHRLESPVETFGIAAVVEGQRNGGGGNGLLFDGWRKCFLCLSNPLLFPIACLCLLPMVTFVLLKCSRMTTTEEAANKKQRFLIGLFSIYYLVFLYDLFRYGPTLDDEREDVETDMNFSHSTLSANDGLVILYVFHHWTRPFTIVLRNVFVAFIWKREENENEKNIGNEKSRIMRNPVLKV